LFPVIAIVVAIAAALVFGISSVAQHRSTKRVKRQRALSPRILFDLVRQPLWVTAISASVVGFTLQVVALRFGRLALVEPILVCDLIFAVLISAYLRRRLDPVEFAGVAACTAGITGFLAIARPSGGQSTVSFHVLLPLAAGLAVVVAGCLSEARRNRKMRPIALALACGVNYGAAAFLVKLVTSEFSGLLQLLSDWPIYALAVIAPVGFLLNQNAFQQGIRIAPVMAIITAADPLVSIALACIWLHEKLNGSPAGIAGEIASLALMITGIVTIAHRSPQAVRQRLHYVRRHQRSHLRADLVAVGRMRNDHFRTPLSSLARCRPPAVREALSSRHYGGPAQRRQLRNRVGSAHRCIWRHVRPRCIRRTDAPRQAQFYNRRQAGSCRCQPVATRDQDNNMGRRPLDLRERSPWLSPISAGQGQI